MIDTTGFDVEEYRDSLRLTAVEDAKERMDRGYDEHNAITEAVFTAADEWIAFDADVEDYLAVLIESSNEPGDVQPYVQDTGDWREMIQGIAFTVVRQDVWDTLEDTGYVNDAWSPTGKLRDEVTVSA